FRTLVWRNGWIFRVRKIGFSYWGVGGYMGSMAALYCKNGESAQKACLVGVNTSLGLQKKLVWFLKKGHLLLGKTKLGF
ncbi:MAG: hypothetical protein ACRCS7_10275, partial [Tannerellaceae bacterium]